jgi:3-hydroxy-9,10-secoandrosta-1,3,5(10)-triene-9,17-dione monooxygenase reductase component
VREVRRQWASGVTVVLTREDDGFRGATVAAFAVVSLEPPTVLVCLDRDGRMSELVPEVGRFTVSILDRDHEFLAERFAARAPLVDARLSGVAHHLAPSGLPVLAGALAWCDCRVTGAHVSGDHVVILGDLIAAATGAGTDDPLLYYDRQYRSIGR